MATLKTISAALKLVDTKKENLKKAYDELQAHSSLLSSFSLSWSDIDCHFTSIQNSLTQRFHSLESLESHQSDPQLERTHQSHSSVDLPLAHNPGDCSLSSLQQIQHPKEPSSSKPPSRENFPPFPRNPSSSSNPLSQNGTNFVTKNIVESDSVVPRHELSALCEKMDGKGLRKYVIEHFRDSNAIQDELLVALRCAPDPAAMVLDSLDEFHGANGMKDTELRKIRRSCLLLLEQLRVISPKLEFNVREKARKLAAEWKGMLMTDGANTLGALGYLHFVVAYGLVSEVSIDELVDFSAMAANSKEVPELCRIIGLTDKVPDLVQKLIDKGKHVLAVKYVCEFNLADKIPPGPILKACVNESKKLAKRIVQEGKPPAEAIAREIHALKSLIKVIESNKLESVYPLASLEQRIEQLNKQKADRKRPAAASAVKPQPQLQQHQQQQQQQRHQQQKKKKQKQQQQGGNKRPRTSAPIAPAAVQMNVSSGNSALHHYQQPLVQPTGLLQEHPNPYMSSQALPYGMVGSTPTFSSYTGPSAGPYGFASVPMSSSGNPSQVGSHLYSTEPNVPSGYYDRIATYGGLPHHYHTSYYPQ